MYFFILMLRTTHQWEEACKQTTSIQHGIRLARVSRHEAEFKTLNRTCTHINLLDDAKEKKRNKPKEEPVRKWEESEEQEGKDSRNIEKKLSSLHKKSLSWPAAPGTKVMGYGQASLLPNRLNFPLHPSLSSPLPSRPTNAHFKHSQVR